MRQGIPYLSHLGERCGCCERRVQRIGRIVTHIPPSELERTQARNMIQRLLERVEEYKTVLEHKK